MIETKILDQKFDKKLFNSKAVHPLQSWEWGEARKKMGINVLRIGEYEGDTLSQVFTITYHHLPNTFFTIGYLPRSGIPSEETLHIIRSESKKRRAVFVKLEPNIYKIKGENEYSLSQNERKRLKMFIGNSEKSSHPLFPQWTQVLHLQQSEKTLLKKMKSKTRYNVGLAVKKGVAIKEMTNNEGFKIFSDLYFKTTKRQSYRGHDYRYHNIIFELLQKDISHILIAFYRNIPLAAYHLFIFNDVIYYPYGGSSDEYKNVMASNLLMWDAIRYGKESGCRLFDMWGSLPPDYDRSASWSGFTRFKEGYGTDFAECIGSYDIVLNRPFYLLYSLAFKARKRIL